MPGSAELAMNDKLRGVSVTVVACLLCLVCIQTSTTRLTSWHRYPSRCIMSGIAFPGQPSSPSSHHHALYPLSFDSAPAGGFQMNPLSAHPPRTPRTSVTTTPFSAHPNTGGEDTEEHPQELELDVDEEDEEEEDGPEKIAARNRVRAQEVLRELLETSAGRDKTFKIIQYAMKVYLLFHLAIFRRVPVQGAKRRAFENALLQRLQSTVSGLSLTRCVPTMRGSGSVLRLGRLNQKVPYHV